MERHENTKGHMNFITCGNIFQGSLNYFVNKCQEADFNEVRKAIYAGLMLIGR